MYVIRTAVVVIQVSLLGSLLWLTVACSQEGPIRIVVPPANVTTPEQAAHTFHPMFSSIKGQWIGEVRWQGQNIVAARSDYDAASETGLQVPEPIRNWQFGPSGMTGRRSTYQVYRRSVGFLALSDDTPELPPTAPKAASKHVAYGYTFPEPYPVFRDASMYSLMLQADLQVAHFVSHDRVTGSHGETDTPVGILYFVMQFEDTRNGIVIPWSVPVWDDRGDLNVERIYTDPSNSKTTVTSRLSADRSNKYFTTLAKGSGVTNGELPSPKWSYRFYITPRNFVNALKAIANRGVAVSLDPRDYVLNSFGIVQEMALQEGDDIEMASTISEFGFYEAEMEHVRGNVAGANPGSLSLD